MAAARVLRTLLITSVLTLGLAGSGVAAPPDAASTQRPPASIERASVESLAAALDTLLDADYLADAKVTVALVDLADGTDLYTRGADTPLNPASNIKLFTTAAALALLGPEHRFSTQLWAAEVKGGVVTGDLVLVGGGDPALVTGHLYELSTQLAAMGITKIQGTVVVDGGRFDGDGLPPGFDQKQELASYRAPSGAASVDFNTYEIMSTPAGEVGQAPTIRPVPDTGLVRIENQAKTVTGGRNRLSFSPRVEGDRIIVTVRGEIGATAATSSHRYPVDDPSLSAGYALIHTLERAGIKVGKTAPRKGTRGKGGRVLVTHRSETVSVLCRSINKLSNNFMAEQLLRTLVPGPGASASQALDRLRAWTKSAGVPQGGLVLGNGSGLYDNNRASARQLIAVLRAMHGDFRLRADFVASLSILGVDGTLHNRHAQSSARGWVRAKTGTLDGASALSGYAAVEGREPVAFAIVFNDLARSEAGLAKSTQDNIIAALEAWLRGQDPRAAIGASAK